MQSKLNEANVAINLVQEGRRLTTAKINFAVKKAKSREPEQLQQQQPEQLQKQQTKVKTNKQ